MPKYSQLVAEKLSTVQSRLKTGFAKLNMPKLKPINSPIQALRKGLLNRYEDPDPAPYPDLDDGHENADATSRILEGDDHDSLDRPTGSHANRAGILHDDYDDDVI
jgi:hypothetical protein